MKKTKLLITLLVMLVAASGYAQDSYREAVKQYLSCNSNQLDKDNNTWASFNDLFVKDDAVNIDKLIKRYIDERLEDATVDFTLPMMKAKGITEADLLEATSLLSTPEGKAFSTDQQSWMLAFSFLAMMSTMDQMGETGLFGNVMSESDLLTINPDIDAAYADKFAKISEKTGFIDLLMKGFNEKAGEALGDEEKEKVLGWLSENAYTIALNSAYEILTPEDLDYAENLYSHESFRKLNDNSEVDLADVKPGVLFNDFLNWMKEHGATVDENSEHLSMLKKMLGIND